MCYYKTRNFTERCFVARNFIIKKYVLLHDTTSYRTIIQKHLLFHDTTLYINLFYCTTQHYTKSCFITWHVIIHNHVLLHVKALYHSMCYWERVPCVIARHDIIQNQVFLHDTTLYRTCVIEMTRNYNEVYFIAWHDII